MLSCIISRYVYGMPNLFACQSMDVKMSTSGEEIRFTYAYITTAKINTSLLKLLGEKRVVLISLPNETNGILVPWLAEETLL